MLRLDRLARTNVTESPYPHVVLEQALDDCSGLNAEFPSKDRFGPPIRMDGDLTAGDTDYDTLIVRSSAYRELHRQVYSLAFLQVFLDVFREPIQRAHARGELVLDPFALEMVPTPVERRVSGQSFVGGGEPFLFPRLDIGYGGVGYGLHNGGRGIHIDNLPRLLSILVFLNSPQNMVGGSHRLYGLRKGRPVLEKVYHPAAGLLIASLQSNRAFHDVAPVEAIDGERRAFYMAVSCSAPIWKKETHASLSILSQNRYDPPARHGIVSKLRSFWRRRDNRDAVRRD